MNKERAENMARLTAELIAEGFNAYLTVSKYSDLSIKILSDDGSELIQTINNPEQAVEILQ